MKLLPLFLLFFIPALRGQVVLNEICARNGTILYDADSTHADWVELYNAGSSVVDLQGWALSDENDNPDRWVFPSVQIQPDSFLIVYLSGKDRVDTELHTNFKLGGNEHLLLSDPLGYEEDEFEDAHPLTDHSWGSITDGDEYHGYTTQPTPGASNNAVTWWPGYAGTPELVLKPGFYNGPQFCPVNNTDPDAQVYYTVDGSIPDATDFLYTGAVPLVATEVIKVVALRPGYLASPVITGTYLLNFQTELPVISISTDPALLFDPVTGLYVNGPNASPIYPHLGANWWQDTEIPVHMEYFTTGRDRKLDQDVGLRMHGGTASRTKPMKSLRLLARKSYGESKMNYQLIPDKQIEAYKKIVLRNSSSDFPFTMFRDGMTQQMLLREKLNIDVIGYQPSVVFINGNYWGIHNIREKISSYYLEENHGADHDAVDMLKEENIVEEGDSADFVAMYNYIMNNNLAVDSSYQRVGNWLDLGSFCDYIIAETFLNNNDWPYNNIKYWRKQEPGAKWRYILFDMDVSFFGESWSPVTLNWLGEVLGTFGQNSKHMRIIRKLLDENQEFRIYFINRYADLLNTSFTPETLRNYIQQAKSRIEAEIPNHFSRWGGSVAAWETEINTRVLLFADLRQQIVRDQVQQEFTAGDQFPLSLDVFPAQSGTIKLNTIQPLQYPWSGIYYKDVPVTLQAVAAPGFKFVHWEAPVISPDPLHGDVITIQPGQEALVRAVFIPEESDESLFYVFPVPASGSEPVTAAFFAEAGTHYRFEVFDAHGAEVYRFEQVAAESGIQRLVFTNEKMAQGVYLFHITMPDRTLTKRFIRSANPD